MHLLETADKAMSDTAKPRHYWAWSSCNELRGVCTLESPLQETLFFFEFEFITSLAILMILALWLSVASPAGDAKKTPNAQKKITQATSADAAFFNIH